MNIAAIRHAEDWSAWSQAWNDLLAESHLPTPFQTYEFQRAWWEHRGGGEWPDAELCILIGLNEEEKLLGIAPFFIAPNEEGLAVLMPIGSHEIADFLDFIVRPEDHAAFAAAVLDHLSGSKAPAFERLAFYNLLDESETVGLLEQAAAEKGWAFEKSVLQPSPAVPIPESFEDYVDALEGKDAREMRRKLRRAARHPVPIELKLVTGGEGLNRALEDFFALMVQEKEKAVFLTPAMRAQMEAIARAAAAGGWLQLAFLNVGQQRAAAYLNFDFEGRIWAYNAGFANEFAELSPGWLLVAEMIDWCIQNGRSAFDFMRGDEDYKYRFGGVDRFVVKVEMRKGSR